MSFDTLELFDKLEQKITDATTTIAGLQQKIAQLNQDHENFQRSQKESEQLMNEMILLEESKVALEGSLKTEKEQNEQLQQELSLSKTNYLDLETVYHSLKEQQASLEEGSTATQNEIEQYKQEITRLNDANIILQEEKEQLKENQQHWQQRVQMVIQKMGQLESQLERNRTTTGDEQQREHSSTEQNDPSVVQGPSLSFSNSYQHQKQQQDNSER